MAMTPLTNRSKQVTRLRMTWVERIYLPAIAKGLSITLKHLFGKKGTYRYPEVLRPRPEVYRGMHVLKRDEAGAERCTACGLCALACPAEAITMQAAERKPGEEKLYREEKYARVYEINTLRCIFCGLCEDACPKEAIFLTSRLVPAENHRKNFIYGKDRLVESGPGAIDVSGRQTTAVAAFKKDMKHEHNRCGAAMGPAAAAGGHR